jgi:hypothetical protein
MAVAHVMSNDSLIGLIAFSRNETRHPDTFVVLNMAEEQRALSIEVMGSPGSEFRAYRTADEQPYVEMGTFTLKDSVLSYEAPARSVTTFYADSS